TLTATSVVGSGFLTWGGDCAASAGNATCTLTMSGDHAVSGSFVSVGFSGLVGSTSSNESGLIIVNIPVASATVGHTARHHLSSSAGATGSVLAIGTLRYLGGTSTAVAW